MALSSQEIRELCTSKEWAIILASQPGAIEKLSAADLKKHASNAQKLVSKWQDLSRSQDRTESRKSGSPNIDSRSHDKHQAFKNALAALQAKLAAAPATSTATPSKAKPTSKARSVEARSQRRSTRKSLDETKLSLNRSAKPAPVRSAPVAVAAPSPVATAAKKTATKKTATKKASSKKPAANAKTKLAAQRKKRAAAIASAAPASPPVKVAKPPKAIAAKGSPTTQTSLAGKVKATRTAIAVRTNKIAGHVSGKGKRAQGKRDARGR